jgi:hypothetical protein
MENVVYSLSSNKIRIEGVCKSSFCPFDIDQKNAAKNPNAISRLMTIIKKIICMFLAVFMVENQGFSATVICIQRAFFLCVSLLKIRVK